MPDTFSAKQVATRIGTDAKTLRKFLRSSASPYDAVGQGGRYEFPKGELGAVKKSFLRWQNNKRPTTVPVNGVNGKDLGKTSIAYNVDPDSARRTREMNPKLTQVIEDGVDFINGIAEDEEPSEDDLDAIDDEGLEID